MRVTILRGGGDGSNSGFPSVTSGRTAGFRAGWWDVRGVAAALVGAGGEASRAGGAASWLKWWWVRRGGLGRGHGSGVLGSRTIMNSVRLRPMSSAATTEMTSSGVILAVVIGNRLCLWHSAMESGDSSRAGGRRVGGSGSSLGAPVGKGRGAVGW